jgi:hypothetical protein
VLLQSGFRFLYHFSSVTFLSYINICIIILSVYSSCIFIMNINIIIFISPVQACTPILQCWDRPGQILILMRKDRSCLFVNSIIIIISPLPTSIQHHDLSPSRSARTTLTAGSQTILHLYRTMCCSSRSRMVSSNCTPLISLSSIS